MSIDREAEGARARYLKALQEFQAANDVLHARVVARSLPTEEEVRCEELARAELVRARRHLLEGL